MPHDLITISADTAPAIGWHESVAHQPGFDLALGMMQRPALQVVVAGLVIRPGDCAFDFRVGLAEDHLDRSLWVICRHSPGAVRPAFFSHLAVVSGKQLVDRCRTRLHLLGGRRGAGALDHPMADEPPLPGRRPVSGQHVTQGRMAPPPGSRGRYRIECCACATPDPGHPASRLRTDPRTPMMRPVTAKTRTGAGNLRLPAAAWPATMTSAEIAGQAIVEQ
jgi:hypothetical protein